MAESEPDLSCRLPAKLSEEEKSEILSKISLEDRAEFFKLSCCPITAEVEILDVVSSFATLRD